MSSIHDQTIEVEIKLPGQVLLDVMTTAVEGGINYWAAIRNVVRDAELNVISFEVRDNEEDDVVWLSVSPFVIARGMRLIIDEAKYPHIVAEIIKQENADLDADNVDVIVQYGVYGEHVFS